MPEAKPEIRSRYTGYTAPKPEDRSRLSITSVGRFLIQDHAYRCSRLHGHKVEHLLYTIRGSAVGMLAGQHTQCVAGSLWFTPKDQPYEYWLAPESEAWEGRWVEYDGAWARELLRMNGLEGVIHVPACWEAAAIVEQLHARAREGSPASLHEAAARLWQLFAVAEACLAGQRRKTDAALAAVERAQEYVRLHLAEPIALEDLAHAAHYSLYHFIRLFRQRTGFTPSAYVRAVRMSRAQELLRGSDLSIKQAGLAVGFSSAQHFSAVFRQATGYSPRAFLRQHRRAAERT